MKINLCAVDKQLQLRWSHHFADCDNVSITLENIFSVPTEAIVSPANSYGFMDGGFDWLLTQRFGSGVQARLQKDIKEIYQGELLVGQAHLVRTHDEQIPYVIAAPTMRVPMILGSTTVNPYLATRAALLCALANRIKSISFTGLGTGVGQVPFDLCASQMRKAYDSVFLESNFPATWREAQLKHMSLFTTSTVDLQNNLL